MVNDIIRLYCRSKAFSSVINGKFPEDAIKRMNIYSLKKLVLDLVHFTCTTAGTNSLCVLNHGNKPRWWPTDVILELDSLLDESKSKEYRITLHLLVIRCCEFFRNKSFQQKWSPANGISSAWVNDENFDLAKTRGVKRIKDITEVNGVKRRKTLSSQNENALLTVKVPAKAVVYLYDIFKSPIDKVLTKQQFLRSLGLILNNNSTKPTSSIFGASRYIKLHNCPHIPLSSDIGQAIIKRENYGVPDYSTTKKIERLEWYLNRTPPKSTPQHYEITYTDDKVSDTHVYRFPKRQFHQDRCNIQYLSLLLKVCKPLEVVIEQEDLISKKKRLDSYKVTVSLPRLSIPQLKKYLCKNVEIRLTKLTSRSKSRSGRLIRRPIILQ